MVGAMDGDQQFAKARGAKYHHAGAFFDLKALYVGAQRISAAWPMLQSMAAKHAGGKSRREQRQGSIQAPMTYGDSYE